MIILLTIAYLLSRLRCDMSTESYRTLVMLRVLATMVSGFVVARYFPLGNEGYWLCGILIAAPVLYTYSHYRPFSRPLLRSVALGLCLFTASYTLYMVNQPDRTDLDISSGPYSTHQMILICEGYPRQRKSLQVKARILAIDSAILHSVNYTQLSIADSSMLDHISPGDTLIGIASLTTNECKSTPYEFNYDEYLLDKGISYRSYMRGPPAIRKKNADDGLVNFVQHTVRSGAIDILRDNLSEENFGIAASMILGYRHELDKELSDQFASTGAIHILAVSGMHVGIVLLILMGILRVFGLGHVSGIRQMVLVGPFLLIYILVTGAAASVVRASLLYFLWQTSNEIERDVSSLNILASAAVIMLVYNPLYLWQVGFQLSFVAVLSIIIFNKYIDKLFYIKRWSVKWIWSIVAVSLSAQILIFPLSLYYFHQFPLLFPVSSIYAILFAFLIIPAGFALLLLGSTSLAPFVASVLDGLCTALRWGIVKMSEWEWSIITSVWLESYELILLYLLLGSLAIFLLSQKKVWLYAFSILLMIGGIWNTFSVYQDQNQVIIKNYDGKCSSTDVILSNAAFISDDHCSPRQRDLYLLSRHAYERKSIDDLCKVVFAN